MIRQLLIAFLALACLTLALTPVLGEDGRDGGIVVLPASTAACSGQRATLATYVFQAGEDIRLQMPVELVKAVTLFEVEGTIVATGSLTGRMLVIDASDISELQATGVQSFRIHVVGTNLHRLTLSFEILADGRVILSVS